VFAWAGALLAVQFIVRIVRADELVGHRRPPKTVLMDGMMLLCLNGLAAKAFRRNAILRVSDRHQVCRVCHRMS
jgi:hypothetical protein